MNLQVIASMIIILLLLFTLFFVFRTESEKNECISKSDCQKDESCSYDLKAGKKVCKFNKKPDDQTKQECTLENLKECDPKVASSCNLCNNEPNFECIQVTDKNPYYFKKTDETGQSISVKIKNSEKDKGWCLPPIITQKNVECNKFTSDSVLIKDIVNGKTQYYWGCYCKNPADFDHNNPSSDCDQVKMCSPNGKLYVNLFNDQQTPEQTCNKNSDCSKFGSDSKCCWKNVDKNTGGCGDVPKELTGYCSEPWVNKKEVDPYTGVCDCNDGSYYFGDYAENTRKYIKQCKNDTCKPNGGKMINGECSCPTGFIRCPEDINPRNPLEKQLCENTGSKCVEDPCAPLGSYNSEKGMCDCAGQNVAIISQQNSVGYVCVDLCENNGNCGERGQCMTVGEGIQKIQGCSPCKLGFSNQNRYYLYDKNKNWRYLYPNDDIAQSWDPNWKNTADIRTNCDNITYISELEKKTDKDNEKFKGAVTIRCDNDSLYQCGCVPQGQICSPINNTCCEGLYCRVNTETIDTPYGSRTEIINQTCEYK